MHQLTGVLTWTVARAGAVIATLGTARLHNIINLRLPGYAGTVFRMCVARAITGQRNGHADPKARAPAAAFSRRCQAPTGTTREAERDVFWSASH